MSARPELGSYWRQRGKASAGSVLVVALHHADDRVSFTNGRKNHEEHMRIGAFLHHFELDPDAPSPDEEIDPDDWAAPDGAA